MSYNKTDITIKRMQGCIQGFFLGGGGETADGRITYTR